MIPAVLTIGGSDSCGGAGIQADLQVFNSFSIKGCSAITALTAQNPDVISRIEAVPLAQLEAEIRAIFSWYDVRAVKTGMLFDAGRIRLIASLLRELHAGKPLIIDPVMVSSSGSRLLETKAINLLVEELFPLATLITPNIPEARILLGSGDEEEPDAAHLAERFSVPVLLKGGHLRSRTLIDVLCIDGEKIVFPHEAKPWSGEALHGTGCRLASAVAASIAKGNGLAVAVADAVQWLQASIETQTD